MFLVAVMDAMAGFLWGFNMGENENKRPMAHLSSSTVYAELPGTPCVVFKVTSAKLPVMFTTVCNVDSHVAIPFTLLPKAKE